jgi:hypothetical protein
MEFDDQERVLLSLKTKKLAYFCEHENERICQHDKQVDERKDDIEFHLSPPNKRLIDHDVLFILQLWDVKVNAYRLFLMKFIGYTSSKQQLQG